MDMASLLGLANPRKPRIVVVEDNRDLLNLYARTLRRAGFAVESRTTSLDLLALASRSDVCAIVLDLVLPGRSGLELLSLLRSHQATRDVPVLMLTGEDSVYRFSEAMARGAVAYMTKPIEPGKLVTMVRKSSQQRHTHTLALGRA